MKLYIGADHAGFALKEKLKASLVADGHEVTDLGNSTFDTADDYPDFIVPVARAVASDPESRGIVIGSSGQGEAMAANRVKGARAFVYYGNALPLPESSKVDKPISMIEDTREDNDSNVISLGASFVAFSDAKHAVTKWLQTPFRGEERHVRRLGKLDESA